MKFIKLYYRFRMLSKPFHQYIQVRSAIELVNVGKAKEFAELVALWTKNFPHHQGFANAYMVALAFNYQDLDDASFENLRQGFKSLEITELNVIIPLGLPNSWTRIAEIIPSSIIRLRLKDCFLAVSYFLESSCYQLTHSM